MSTESEAIKAFDAEWSKGGGYEAARTRVLAALRRVYRDELWHTIWEKIQKNDNPKYGRWGAVVTERGDGDSDEALPDFAILRREDYGSWLSLAFWENRAEAFDRWYAADKARWEQEVLEEAGERAYERYLRAGSTLFDNWTQEDVACDLARFVRGEVEKP